MHLFAIKPENPDGSKIKNVLSHSCSDYINNHALAIEIACMKYYIRYCHRDKINDIDPGLYIFNNPTLWKRLGQRGIPFSWRKIWHGRYTTSRASDMHVCNDDLRKSATNLGAKLTLLLQKIFKLLLYKLTFVLLIFSILQQTNKQRKTTDWLTKLQHIGIPKILHNFQNYLTTFVCKLNISIMYIAGNKSRY